MLFNAKCSRMIGTLIHRETHTHMKATYRWVKLLGVVQYYIIYRSRDHTIGSHFVGQKKNEINRVTPISQHSNEVLRTRNSS